MGPNLPTLGENDNDIESPPHDDMPLTKSCDMNTPQPTRKQRPKPTRTTPTHKSIGLRGAPHYLEDYIFSLHTTPEPTYFHEAYNNPKW